MCFEKAAKPLSLSLDSFPLADHFNNFTSFFIWQVKGGQVLREIKLVPWSGTMPGKVKQLHFPHRRVGPSRVCTENCLDLLKSAGGAHTNWLVEMGRSAGSCLGRSNGPGVADSFLSLRLNGLLFERENGANPVCSNLLWVT